MIGATNNNPISGPHARKPNKITARTAHAQLTFQQKKQARKKILS